MGYCMKIRMLAFFATVAVASQLFGKFEPLQVVSPAKKLEMFKQEFQAAAASQDDYARLIRLRTLHRAVNRFSNQLPSFVASPEDEAAIERQVGTLKSSIRDRVRQAKLKIKASVDNDWVEFSALFVGATGSLLELRALNALLNEYRANANNARKLLEAGPWYVSKFSALQGAIRGHMEAVRVAEQTRGLLVQFNTAYANAKEDSEALSALRDDIDKYLTGDDENVLISVDIPEVAGLRQLKTRIAGDLRRLGVGRRAIPLHFANPEGQ